MRTTWTAAAELRGSWAAARQPPRQRDLESSRAGTTHEPLPRVSTCVGTFPAMRSLLSMLWHQRRGRGRKRSWKLRDRGASQGTRACTSKSGARTVSNTRARNGGVGAAGPTPAHLNVLRAVRRAVLVQHVAVRVLAVRHPDSVLAARMARTDMTRWRSTPRCAGARGTTDRRACDGDSKRCIRCCRTGRRPIAARGSAGGCNSRASNSTRHSRRAHSTASREVDKRGVDVAFWVKRGSLMQKWLLSMLKTRRQLREERERHGRCASGTTIARSAHWLVSMRSLTGRYITRL